MVSLGVLIITLIASTILEVQARSPNGFLFFQIFFRVEEFIIMLALMFMLQVNASDRRKVKSIEVTSTTGVSMNTVNQMSTTGSSSSSV